MMKGFKMHTLGRCSICNKTNLLSAKHTDLLFYKANIELHIDHDNHHICEECSSSIDECLEDFNIEEDEEDDLEACPSEMP